MRRRPMEFWWIAAYCAARSTLLFAGLFPDRTVLQYLADIRSSDSDRGMIILYAFAMFCVPFLLFSAHSAGRWLGTIVLGVEAANLARRMAECAELGNAVDWDAPLAFAACLWLSLYLQRPSTARFFKSDADRADESAPVSFSAGFDVFCLFDAVLALLAGYSARTLGAPVWLSIAAGVGIYIAYGVFLEDALRQRWDSFFARIEPGFPESEARGWRGACGALARNDLGAARRRFGRMTLEARTHPAGRLFEMAVEWHGLLSHPPANGREALRRSVFDHDFNLLDDDRKRIAKYVNRAAESALRKLADERIEFIAALVLAASNPASFFRARADRMLARMTGEAFAFNAPESWAAWWRAHRAHWTGDAGPVAIIARLIFRDCHSAAVDAARKIAGRAEEPLLVELAEQMRFFDSMRDAAKGVGAPASFMNHPLQVLLVPEWADAAGWLHADSPILASLGVTRRAAARRLALRARLLDYAASFWKRYPADLNADPPWLLPLLAGRNFGVLRARVKFEAWWPKSRASFAQHARAMNAGLSAFALGDIAGAEREFENALRERPADLSARYNLSLCRLKRGDRDGAEHLLRELTGMEPKEPYWWMALGDLLRSGDKALAARAAYRRAQHLGASEGRVALHLGLTFAHEARDSEAMQLFARALGNNPTASKLEALAMQLENEGCWKLAGHYREEALRRELDGNGGPSEGGDETAA